MTIQRFLLVLALSAGAAAQANAQDASEHDHADASTRDAAETPRPGNGSGTSWLPASAPMEMFHFESGDWNFMVHGFANFAYQQETGARESNEFFATNMAMFSAGRGAGAGRFRFRVMATLEPTLGADGYPLLLQTGETADGTNPLFDRQHPHDLMMELGLRYDRPIGDTDELFVYFAPVGDPALGPTAFMHRFPGIDNPVAPITHHWIDATHISYGVLTFGWNRGNKVQLEGSIFNGREPDAERWDIEGFRLDSFSARFSANPWPNWSFQGSIGQLTEPERLHPGQDVLRMTASVTHNLPLGDGNWQSTLAWGRNKWEELPSAPTELPPGVHIHFTPGVQPTRSAVLAESGIRFKGMHSVFGRWEWAEKDELLRAADRRHSLVYNVSKLNVGYLIDFLRLTHLRVGAGVYGSLHWVPDDLDFVYGERPTSYGFYFRFKIV